MHKQCLGSKFFHMAHTIFENQAELGFSEENLRKVKDLKINTKKSLIKSTAEITLPSIPYLSLNLSIFGRFPCPQSQIIFAGFSFKSKRTKLISCFSNILLDSCIRLISSSAPSPRGKFFRILFPVMSCGGRHCALCRCSSAPRFMTMRCR